MNESFYTLPTQLTWIRIFAIPFLILVYYIPFENPNSANIIATVLFVFFALTDWLDGYLARKLKQTSAFGAFLDPVADKILVCACILILVHLGRVNVFIALIIISREITISALREWMAQIGASKSVAVHMIGKIKTTIQMLAIAFLLLDNSLTWFNASYIGTILIWIAAILTVWSMLYYIKKAIPEIKLSLKKE